MKKKIVIIISIIILGIIALWFGGIIPKQIGKMYGIKYMEENFPEMELEYKGIEWNKFYGDYIISFKDKDGKNYGCVIGPKYLPINMGQGINEVQETYKEKYISNITLPYIPEGMDVADESAGKTPANEIQYNRDVSKVTIEVIEDSITNKSVDIRVTDNNQLQYGWGVSFKIQEKVSGKWKELNYLYGTPSWIEIAYSLDENNQFTQKINIEKYYGKLSKGVYRVVKSVYDNKYIDIYSDEFEIE